jgi:hypothetical protein
LGIVENWEGRRHVPLLCGTLSHKAVYLLFYQDIQEISSLQYNAASCKKFPNVVPPLMPSGSVLEFQFFRATLPFWAALRHDAAGTIFSPHHLDALKRIVLSLFVLVAFFTGCESGRKAGSA